jgi:predicted acyl esterase
MRAVAVPFLAALLALIAAPAAEAFDAHGSARQVYVTGLPAKAKASLIRPDGSTAKTRTANALGGTLFRNVKPRSGYKVRSQSEESGPLTVFSNASAPPSTDIYTQQIPSSGYGYLTTRDGTQLAINVHPAQGTLAPKPTLIEYAGYGYADPAGPRRGIAPVANLMGFTVVDVNMRGTGCSGGAFDFFEPLQNLDGYDVIETVARQPWVLHNKVGMMGISYGGMSQLFSAQTRPPSLAAIAPLSVIDQTQTTLYPGGILNTGFAVAWAKERDHDAEPASPNGGQPWAYKRVQDGDRTCAANQALHGEAVSQVKKTERNRHYRPKVADPLSPITFVNKIDVPTFMACQWTDEQTGGHCPTLPQHFTGTSRKWFTFTNGTHTDALDPETFNRWYDFLKLYVAREAPSVDSAKVRAASPIVYQAALGIPGMTLPRDPIQEQPTYQGALAAFERLKPVRILFDNGAGSDPGKPYPAFEHSFARFPAPGTKARTWYFGAKGTLAGNRAKRAMVDTFRWNAHARPMTNFTGDTRTGENGLWTATPRYTWSQNPKGTAVSYVSTPLNKNTVVIGAGSVTAWVRSSKPSVDLQATITEVRPDGKETFVQSGWVRGNERKLDKRKSTRLEPVLGLRKRDVRAMPQRRFVKVTIPLYYQGHAYRKGSRIRVILSAPNGDQPIWAFARTRPKGKATVRIAHSRKRPSNLLLPVVRGVDVKGGLPPCPGLRGEPCRDYRP